MSDGSLSQDEIDALLMSDGPPSTPPIGSGPAAGSGAIDKDAILGLFGGITGAQSATLSGIMVKSVTVGAPQMKECSREEFLAELPDEVVEIKINYKSGLEGSHMYVIHGDDALKIATPMIGLDNLELDGTSLNAISEAMSQITGAASNTIGDRINQTILTESPEGQSVTKGNLSLPGDRFVVLSYNLEIEDQGELKLYEVFDQNTVQDLAVKLGADSKLAPQDSSSRIDLSNLGDIGTPSGQSDTQGFQQMSPDMGGQAIGGLGSQQPPQVHGVQLPELMPSISASEQRNIGLLMDVSMELTVELGRTKWRIKDILGMGEGTIIELDNLAGEPVDILVNNNLIARGEVVVIDENFGVRVTEIVSTMDRMSER